ncbi:hypothetical protein NHX12_023898, partial [Muraenolepis orangiensis]
MVIFWGLSLIRPHLSACSSPCDGIFVRRYGRLFTFTQVVAFSRSSTGNATVEVQLVFNETASPQEIPSSEDVVETLRIAAANTTAGSISFDSDSIVVKVRWDLCKEIRTAFHIYSSRGIQCDGIFVRRYGRLFTFTQVVAFSRSSTGNATVEVQLVFNETASPQEIPSSEDVVETLRIAAANTTAGSISFDSDSIVVKVRWDLCKEIRTAFHIYSSRGIQCDGIFVRRYGRLFTFTQVVAFSRSSTGNATVEVQLVFNETASPQEIPSSEDVVETLRIAAANTTAGSISFDSDSIVVKVRWDLCKEIRTAFHIYSSRGIQCDGIFVRRYGRLFTFTQVVAFSRSSTGNATVEVQLVFNETASPQEIPSSEDVVETLRIAAANTTAGSISFDSDSIVVKVRWDLCKEIRTAFHIYSSRGIQCDGIFVRRYGRLFTFTQVVAFSRSSTGNATVEVQLVFNETASPQEIPSSEDVVETLRIAAANTTAGSISFDSDSIVVKVRWDLCKEIRTAFHIYSSRGIQCDGIFVRRYGRLFTFTQVVAFSRSSTGNATVEVQLVFNETASPQEIPSSEDVVETLRIAAANTTAGSISFDSDSIVVKVRWDLCKEIRTAFHIYSSRGIQCDGIFVRRYGRLFTFTQVVAFSRSSTGNATVEVQLVFNETASPQEIPSSEDVVETLRIAAANTTAGSISFDSDSIVVKVRWDLCKEIRTAFHIYSSRGIQCDGIFVRRYGRLFTFTQVVAFSRSSTGNATVEVQLVFNETASPQEIPSSEDVVETLRIAAANTTAGSISFDSDSIVVKVRWIFVRRYGRLFTFTQVVAFSRSSTGNATVEVQLVFNETASPQEIPSSEDVVETLRIAAANTTAGSISFDSDSIVVKVRWDLCKEIRTAFHIYSSRGIQCDGIFVRRYGRLFTFTQVVAFSRSSTGNATVEVQLVFNETASPQEIPSSEDVVETLRIAAANTTAGSISFDSDSIVVKVRWDLCKEIRTAFHIYSSRGIQCDGIFVRRYGRLFTFTQVVAFSRSSTGNATVEVQLVFNETASPQEIPSSEDVVETLRIAAANTTAGSISFDSDSIVVKVRWDLCKEIRTAFHIYSSRGIQCDGIFVRRYGRLFTFTQVVAFSRSSTGNATVEVQLVFNATASPQEIPSSEDVVETLRIAAANTTAGSISFDSDSIVVKAPPTSFSLVVTIMHIFEQQLSNKTSPEYQALESMVVTTCNSIYMAQYGNDFLRTAVLQFRPATVTRMVNTELDLELVFNETASSLPTEEDVAQTLRTTNISSDNVIFVLSSIVVERINTTTTTVSPTTAVQSASTSTLVDVRLKFRSSFGETFSAALSDPSSPAFKERATQIKSGLEPFYKSAFTSFDSLEVTEF